MGHNLVELHSVLVVIGEVDGASSEVYGEIKVVDCAEDAYVMFNEERERSKSISEDGTLPLTDAPRCLLSSDFAFAVHLKERHLDLEVTNGYLCMSTLYTDDWFDKSMRALILGKDGYSVLHFSVFKEAIQATVDVALITTSKEIRPAFHGEIVVHDNKRGYKSEYERKYHRTRLFSACKEEPKESILEEGAQEEEAIFKIPLSRRVVAVPSYSPLWIEANLGISFPMTLAQAVNMTGSVKFNPYRLKPKTTKVIAETCVGRVEVKVTWNMNVLNAAFPDIKFGS